MRGAAIAACASIFQSTTFRNTCAVDVMMVGPPAAPRIHHQWFPEVLGVEPEIGADVIAGLGKSGHKVKTFPHIGTVNLLVKTDSGIEAAAEPRSPSKPAGY